MKTTADRIEHIEYLMKRKDRIRVQHLLSIKQHLNEVKKCEAQIKKYQDELKALQTLKNV